MLKSKFAPKTANFQDIALIGNPNSGKSTLFNCLTGSNQQIGNWPGVTVEQKIGKYLDQKLKLRVVDLPGCYSLVATADMSLDEQITCKHILHAQDTIYLNVVDACHLSRDLYLSLQLLEVGVPVIIALNCMDLAKNAGIKIDVQALERALGCTVIPIVAKTGKNLNKLQKQIANLATQQPPVTQNYQADYPPLLSTTINFWRPYLNNGQALHVLEGDSLLVKKLNAAGIDVTQVRGQIELQLGVSLDLYIAQHRIGIVARILHTSIAKKISENSSLSEKIDAWVLHKISGPIIFTAVMYLMFTLAINMGGFLQAIFEQASEIILVDNFAGWLLEVGTPSWLIDILANGLGRGINITVTFIPVLAAMFLCLGILEGSGYMMRAAFIVDRLMRLIGLSGKAFVPMIVGFGCNVPAVMGARTLSNRRERILTIMMTPFMSCSARLAIYAIFVAAFFPVGGQHIIFSLYVIGILVAILTGLALSTPVLAGERSISVMEMPDYRWPLLSSLLRQVWHRLKSFLVKAGALIILLCVIINGLGSNTLEKVGKSLTPAFAPIGITAENWPATVGLVTGLIAKEAVIGTLNSVYKNTANSADSLENNLVKGFGGPVPAYAYLLFTLLYFPCASVVAVIAKELNKKWALFSVVWSTSIAYIIAALFYQSATWNGLRSASSLWILSLLLLLAGLFIAARLLVTRDSVQNAKYKLVPTPVNLL
jgi:ferrous iron transport protein B